MIITELKLEAALNYLRDTDETCAAFKVEVSRKEYLCKIARAKIFINAEGSVEQRKALAEVSQEVGMAEEARFTMMGEFEKQKAKRETNTLIIEIWRTEAANKRSGNI